MMRWAGALTALILGMSGAAAAQSMTAWTDPAGTLTLQRPSNWPVDRMPDSSEQVTHYAVGLAAAECSIFSIVRANTAGFQPSDIVRSFSTPLTREQWFQVTTSVSRIFHGQADIQSMSVDASGFWPVQRATIMSGSDRIEAALAARPGREFWTFCQSFDERDRTEIFNGIIASVASPQDAAWQAQAAAAAANGSTAPPALAPAPSNN